MQMALLVSYPAERPFYFYVRNLMDNSANLQELMIFVCVSNASRCIMNKREDDLPILRDEGQILIQRYQFHSDLLVNAV